MKNRPKPPQIAFHLFMIILSLLWLTPLLWSFIASTRELNDVFSRGHIWWGKTLSTESYKRAFELAPFGRYYLNTVLQVVLILGVQIITSSLAAFAFAYYRFKGERFFFLLILTQMMIPTAALLVPNFQTIRLLGVYDTIPAIALPFFGSAFGTFLLRQAFLEIPRDLADAAEIDGCRWDQILTKVYLPSSTASLTAFSISSVSWHWNDFLWPLIVTQSDRVRPLTAGLVRFTQMGEIGAQWALLSAATMIVTLPLFILFILFQKRFVEGYLHSGIK
ncbi:MAG: carbohydrate ABC transporter permease [Spirochaetales bacterium]|nr:carbohydrate ABC transporter permease [Spirochaetales bacterium]